MKLRKIFTSVIAGVLAVGMMATAASCELISGFLPGLDSANSSSSTPEQVEKKSYQLTGEYKENLAALGGGFDFLLNLNDDGSAVLARYNPFSYNGDDAATNRAYDAEYMKGTWKAAKKDGVDCLQIKLAVHNEDGTTTNDVTAYAYDVAGVYSFELNFPLVVGMSFTRTCTLSGGESKVYADANAFIQAKKLTFEAPANIARFDSVNEEGEKTNGTVYVQEDGTLLAYSGYTHFATGAYTKSTEGETVNFGITMEGKEVEVTVEGNKASFSCVYSMGGGYDITYNFVCEDISVLPNLGAAASTEVKYLGSYGEGNYSITILSETECKYANEAYVSMGLTGFECTYTKDANGTLTLTVKEEPTNPMLQGVWAGMQALTWTITGENTMAVKYFGTSGDATYSITILSDTECKYANEAYVSMGLSGFECTYVKAEDGTLTLTVKEEPTNPMLQGVWAGMKDITWKLGAGATMTTVA